MSQLILNPLTNRFFCRQMKLVEYFFQGRTSIFGKSLLHSKMVFLDYLSRMSGNVKSVSIKFVAPYGTYVRGISKFMEH